MSHETTNGTGMTRRPFLQQVAQIYTDNERENVANYCFVVPNKRSAVFLSKYFSEALTSGENKAALAPSVITISDFISDLSDKVEISRIEMLFILYDVYAGIVKEHLSETDIANGKGLVDFNRFQYWGDILINDFGDVDRYMVDASQLFRNIEGLREISANYLTDEQIEVIRKYWNEDLVPEPVKEFWKHAVHTTKHGQGKANNKNVAGFVKLWQVMHEVYDSFRQRLSERGYGYGGMIYREVAEKLKEIDVEEFSHERYIFTGFSVLSTSEQSIFSSMQKLGIADFYWDYASPAMHINGNRASRFISHYVKDYKSRYNVGIETVDTYPDITVLAVPSTFGQAKAIVPILQRLYPQRFADNSDGNDDSGLEQTAIVLPDENLVSPILNAMPKQISSVNVTMGFQLNHTSVASLIKNIVSMQLRARELRSLDTFFFEDVISLLTHPLIRARYASISDTIVSTINQERIFNLPVTFFDNAEYEPLRPVFSIVKNLNDSDGVIKYLDGLLRWLEHVISPESDANDADPIDADSEDVGHYSTKLELQYIRSYRAALDELRRLNDKYLKNGQIFLEDKTVFHLAERILGNQSVAYEGMPLEGLQIMGVLEARCLDFDNIIMTSMNERVFPRKHYAKTFIPDALRRGYGMATIDHQESMYAYYFYRLIARAKHVYLLYDARTSGLRAGDMSRYINQIKYQFPTEKVTFAGSQYRISSAGAEVLTVKKTPRIIAELQKYCASSDKPRYLSAHSLNTYINCPMQFYIANIERYYPENEVHDYMDEGTYGTIVHEAAEKMYVDLKGDNPSLPLTEDVYKVLQNEEYIGKYVEQSLKKYYLAKSPDDPTPLQGDAEIFKKLMVRTLLKMFEREQELKGIEFLSGEESEYGTLKVNDKYTINLNFRIDRVDRVANTDNDTFIRLIDYKTGSDKMSAPSIDRLFEHGKATDQPKAIFQLLLYCNAYAQKHNYNGPIQPYIYKLRRVAVDEFKPLVINRNPITDYGDINEEFMQRLGSLLDEMFDIDTPFMAYPGKDNCKYCKFQELCSAN